MALVALSGAMLISFGLAELGLRLFWTLPSDRNIHSFDFETALQRDPELGYVPRANATIEYPPYHASFTTNADGLRGPRVPKERVPGRSRIVVLGDSFAWGHGVSAGLAFPEVIDDALPESDVVNLGVPGYDLAKALAFYRRVGRSYQPDVVVVSLCQNDFVARESGELDKSALALSATPTFLAKTGDVPVARGLKLWLRDHSYVYALVQQTINTRKSLSRMAVSLGLKEELAGFEMLDDNLRPALKDAPPCMQRSRERVRGQLLALRDQIQSDGATFVIALIPSIQLIDESELSKSIAYTRYEASDFDLNEPMRMLSAFCREHDIRIVDPTGAFRTAFAKGERLYLPGDLHFNENGHALFAREILAALPQPDAKASQATSSRIHSRATRQRSSR